MRETNSENVRNERVEEVERRIEDILKGLSIPALLWSPASHKAGLGSSWYARGKLV